MKLLQTRNYYKPEREEAHRTSSKFGLGPKSGFTAISSEFEKNFATLGKLKPVLNCPSDLFYQQD